MLEMNLSSGLIILGLLLTFFGYVATVSYRLGTLTQRVRTNERAIEEGKTHHASKDDMTNVKETLGEIKASISKLYTLLANK